MIRWEWLLLVGLVAVWIGFEIGVKAARLGSEKRAWLKAIKELEREIATDQLECAKQERAAATLRAIPYNERAARGKR
jgi:hypothetical protein